MKKLPLSLLLLATLGCAGPKVTYDCNVSAPFAQYQTFDWQAAPRGRGGANPIMDARVKGAVERELQARGLRLEKRGEPDLLVSWYPGARTRSGTRARVGVGLGLGPVRGLGLGVSAAGSPGRGRVAQDLVLEVEDARTRQVVWKATAEKALETAETPEDADAQVAGAVQALLKRFPRGR
jgi:hypothetical protein